MESLKEYKEYIGELMVLIAMNLAILIVFLMGIFAVLIVIPLEFIHGLYNRDVRLTSVRNIKSQIQSFADIIE